LPFQDNGVQKDITTFIHFICWEYASFSKQFLQRKGNEPFYSHATVLYNPPVAALLLPLVKKKNSFLSLHPTQHFLLGVYSLPKVNNWMEATLVDSFCSCAPQNWFYCPSERWQQIEISPWEIWGSQGFAMKITAF